MTSSINKSLAVTATILFLFLFLSGTVSSHASPPLPKGFSLELIHTHHPHPNLFLNDDMNETIHGIHPSIYYRPFTYMVNITLPPDQSHLLALDTGSGLVWTQCKPCDGCPPQAHTPFDPTRSPTNIPYSCPSTHSLCTGPRYECKDEVCHYAISYVDRSSMKGRLSLDTFSFGGGHHYGFLILGCTHAMANWRSGHSEGVFGMNQHKFSFATQMSGFSDSLSRFSYCFTDPTTRWSSFLRFGDDIPLIDSQVQRIKMDNDTCRDGHYYFDLRDISLDAKRLNLTAGTFARREDGNGGFVIHTGSSVSLLIGPAYDVVRSELVKYFGKYDLRRVEQWKEWRMDLCYEMPDISISWPVMTLHFSEADLVVNQIFLRSAKMFCWAMVRSDEHTFLGAVQQRNVRFVFDLKRREVQFAEEDCALTG